MSKTELIDLHAFLLSELYSHLFATPPDAFVLFRQSRPHSFYSSSEQAITHGLALFSDRQFSVHALYPAIETSGYAVVH